MITAKVRLLCLEGIPRRFVSLVMFRYDFLRIRVTRVIRLRGTQMRADCCQHEATTLTEQHRQSNDQRCYKPSFHDCR